MTVKLGPQRRIRPRETRCRVRIDGREAGSLVRTASPGGRAVWFAEGPVREVFPVTGYRGARKSQVLRLLRRMLRVIGPERRRALAAALEGGW